MSVTGSVKIISCPSQLKLGQGISITIDGDLYDDGFIPPWTVWYGRFKVVGNGITRQANFSGVGHGIGPESPPTFELGYMPDNDIDITAEIWALPFGAFSFQYIGSATAAIEYLTPPPPPVFTCPYCGQEFATQALRTAHIKSAHPGEPPVDGDGDGKFPWAWVAIGAATVGGIALLTKPGKKVRQKAKGYYAKAKKYVRRKK